jgi:hypothetical protein
MDEPVISRLYVHIAANVTSQGHCICDIVSAICIMSGCLRCLSGGRSDSCVRVGGEPD